MSWLRLRNSRRASSNGTYLNLDNGNRLGVGTYSSYGTEMYEVWLRAGQRPAETVADGYPTEKEALAALDALMSEYKFTELQPPVSDEEKSEDEQEEEDN